jgi:hypothetical protein
VENRANHKTVVRIPKDVYALIVAKARDNERSINGEMVYALRLYVNQSPGVTMNFTDKADVANNF